jgi:hypothetical protein
MLTHDIATHAGEEPCEPDGALVYCDLFGDRVAERVCHLLKKELNACWRCDLFCRGGYRAHCSDWTEGRQAPGGNVRRSLCMNQSGVTHTRLHRGRKARRLEGGVHE